jgi:hypothetical protein
MRTVAHDLHAAQWPQDRCGGLHYARGPPPLRAATQRARRPECVAWAPARTTARRRPAEEEESVARPTAMAAMAGVARQRPTEEESE